MFFTEVFFLNLAGVLNLADVLNLTEVYLVIECNLIQYPLIMRWMVSCNAHFYRVGASQTNRNYLTMLSNLPVLNISTSIGNNVVTNTLPTSLTHEIWQSEAPFCR